MESKIDEINAVVDEELTEASDCSERSGRDYVKDGLAIGAGLLALDGLYHVGKFVWTKGVKPAGQKIGSGLKKVFKKKTPVEKAKDAAIEVIDDVKDKVEEIVEKA